MQLDQTTIRIRERGTFETLDLALHVIRRWWGWLFGSLLVVAAPLALWHAWLVEFAIRYDDWESLTEAEQFSMMFRYVLDLSLIAWLAAPLVGTFTTLVLGNLVFESEPRLRDALRGTRRPILRHWVHHLVLRGVGAGWLLLASAATRESTYTFEEFLLLMLAGLVALFRLGRPHLPEIFLLEKLPWKAGTSAVSLNRRTAALHSAFSGDVIGRGLLLLCCGGLLAYTLLGSLLFANETLFFSGVLNRTTLRLGFPIVIAVIMLYSAVVRFLNYLDLRVRSEGWEIELQLRAEAERLEGQVMG